MRIPLAGKQTFSRYWDLATTPLFSTCEWCAGALERHPWRWLAGFLSIFATAGLAEAARRKMWIDEIFTIYGAQHPFSRDLLGICQPPAYEVLVRALQPVLGDGALDVRLPALAGYCVMCACVFVFMKRHYPASYAAVAMLFASIECLNLATEGRFYGMVLGCSGLALVSWQAACEGNRRHAALVALFLSLAFATAFHYWAIFLLLPFAAGELVRWQKRARLDWPILFALAGPPLVLALHWPLLKAGSVFIPNFWSKSSLSMAVSCYYGLSGKFLPVMALLLVLAAVWQPPVKSAESRHEGQRYGMPLHEWVAILTLSALPALAVLVSLLSIRAFVGRYVEWAAIGLAILAAAALFVIARGNPVMSGSVVCLLAAFLGCMIAIRVLRTPTLIEGEAMSRELANVPADPAPILVADSHIFMELAYYEDPKVRGRLVYALSPELERRYTNTDTTALIFSALRHRAPLPMPDYKAFLALNKRFLLAANGNDWIVWNLIASGYRVIPLQGRWSPGVFLVQAPDAIVRQ